MDWIVNYSGTVPMPEDAGADPNAVNEYSCTAMHYAAREGWSPTIEVLYKYGADVNVKNEIGLGKRLSNHRCGVEISVPNYFNFTALELATVHNYKQIVSLFNSWGSEDAMRDWQQRYGEMFRQSHDPANFNPLTPRTHTFIEERDSDAPAPTEADRRYLCEPKDEEDIAREEEGDQSDRLLGDSGTSDSIYDENTPQGLVLRTIKQMNARY
eukprot:179535-Hanusia_phi.AAC.3